MSTPTIRVKPLAWESRGSGRGQEWWAWPGGALFCRIWSVGHYGPSIRYLLRSPLDDPDSLDVFPAYSSPEAAQAAAQQQWEAFILSALEPATPS